MKLNFKTLCAICSLMFGAVNASPYRFLDGEGNRFSRGSLQRVNEDKISRSSFIEVEESDYSDSDGSVSDDLSGKSNGDPDLSSLTPKERFMYYLDKIASFGIIMVKGDHEKEGGLYNYTMQLIGKEGDNTIEMRGMYGDKIKLNGEIYNEHLRCTTKEEAQAEISKIVYEDLLRKEEAVRSMMESISRGDTTDNIQSLLEENPFLVDAKFNNQSMFDYAKQERKDDIAQLLTDFREEQVLVQNIYEKIKGTEISDKFGIQGKNITQNIRPKKNELLCFAVETSNLDLVDLLIQISADVNGEDGQGYTPLFYTKNVEVAEKLIKHGADINHKSGDNRTLLTNSIANSSRKREPEEKKLPWVKFVLKRIAKDKINEPTDLGNAALHIAAKFNYSKIAQMLIEAGAGLNVKNKEGMTPLMCASKYDSKEIAEMLLPKSTPEEIGQALQVAVKYKSKKVIDVIVDGVDFSKEQLKTIFKSIAIDQ